jgi:hypothetical protein
MPAESMVNCPSCGASLPTAGLVPGVLVQCARCNWQFRLGEAVVPTLSAPAGTAPALPPLVESEGTSGLAITSFVLGLVPCFCLTGIPAIFCGAVALSEISKETSRLRGSVLATLGIILGVIWTLLCAAPIGGFFWLGRTIEENVKFFDDPATVAQTADDIGVPEPPDGLKPIGGGDAGIFGMRGVLYGDNKNNPNSVIIVVQFPTWLPWDEAQMEDWTRQMWNAQQQQQQQQAQGFRIEEERTVTYTVRGEELAVKELLGKDTHSGRRSREYIAIMRKDDRPVFVIVHAVEPAEEPAEPTEPAKAVEKPPVEKPETEPAETPKPETAPKPVYLTEDDVKKFFESLP